MTNMSSQVKPHIIEDHILYQLVQCDRCMGKKYLVRGWRQKKVDCPRCNATGEIRVAKPAQKFVMLAIVVVIIIVVLLVWSQAGNSSAPTSFVPQIHASVPMMAVGSPVINILLGAHQGQMLTAGLNLSALFDDPPPPAPGWLLQFFSGIKDIYLSFLTAAVLVIGAGYTLKAVFLAALLVQGTTALIFFMIVWLVGSSITKNADVSLKAGLIVACMACYTESLMSIAVPWGWLVMLVETVAGVVIFIAWRGFGYSKKWTRLTTFGENGVASVKEGVHTKVRVGQKVQPSNSKPKQWEEGEETHENA